MEFLIFFGGFVFGALFVFIPFRIISANNSKSAELIDKQQQQMFDAMKLQFENIANQTLKDNTKEFSEYNKLNSDELFKRFKDVISEFEKKAEQNFKTEAEKFNTFDNNIKNFIETGNRISRDANSLVSVMKADNRKSGKWGEIVLERVLEVSGLRKGEEYEIQLSNNEGRPDATIFLPDNRYVYIDAKTSFQAWYGYLNSDNDTDKHTFLKQFIESTKSHISCLAKRDYSVEPGSPDYVLMFIPIESCYSLMFCDDCKLWDFARENNVMPVSPSTLLAALKIINSFLTTDKQNKNILEMAKLCTGIHDKFADLLVSLNKISDCLKDAVKKLNGQDNIITKIEKLEKLGCKFNKKLPEISVE